MREEMWYPEFGLKDDPFQYNDFRNEMWMWEGDEIPAIRTGEVERIKYMRATGFIIGDKGVGKSTILWMAVRELKEKDHLFATIASPSLAIFYGELFSSLCRFYYSLTTTEEKEDKAYFIIEEVNKDWFDIRYAKRPLSRGDQILLDRIDCCYPYCRLRRRCKIPIKGITDILSSALDGEHLHWALLQIEKYCPLKAHIVQKLVRKLPSTADGRFKFLLDVPDDLDKGFNDFKETVRIMQMIGTAVIMVTNKQYEKLKKSDYFSRFVPFNFTQMTNEELKQLYHKRLKWKQAEGSYPPLLTDEALDHVVRKSIRNPRMLLQILEEVVMSMQAQHKVSSADVTFVEQKSKTAGLFSVDDLVLMLVNRYKEQRKRWVPVGQSVVDIREQFNVEISERTLGRKLISLYQRGVIPDHRYNPDSQYLYYVGTIELLK